MVMIAAIASGIALISIVLWEGFETIILPRRVTRRFRLTRLFYKRTWVHYYAAVTACVPSRMQDSVLSFFGPLSLLLLLGIWAGGLITGFALLQSAIGLSVLKPDDTSGFLIDLYMSATTFFTLGLGDAVPANSSGRFLVAMESGLGFGFLALVIGYLPVLNQSFSRREVNISLLDARAGSPPSAAEMLRRHGHNGGMESLRQVLHEWERWSAELLEGHLSYPVLAYFRSQHENQSWLAALTAILDTCTLIMVCVPGTCVRQAELTFAIARHALVDLSLVFETRPRESDRDRLPPERLAELRDVLMSFGIDLQEDAYPRLNELRRMYEPYVHVLASYFRLNVPAWVSDHNVVDNWQTSTWEPRAVGELPADRPRRLHF